MEITLFLKSLYFGTIWASFWRGKMLCELSLGPSWALLGLSLSIFALAWIIQGVTLARVGPLFRSKIVYGSMLGANLGAHRHLWPQKVALYWFRDLFLLICHRFCSHVWLIFYRFCSNCLITFPIFSARFLKDFWILVLLFKENCHQAPPSHCQRARPVVAEGVVDPAALSQSVGAVPNMNLMTQCTMISMYILEFMPPLFTKGKTQGGINSWESQTHKFITVKILWFQKGEKQGA